MNIKVAAFTVSEKSSNRQSHSGNGTQAKSQFLR